jgi:TetR/AcrR family transcriptional regulator, tetracycline repressor protein
VTPPAAERLNREKILSSALALAEAEGLDGVTLRRIAAEWKVTPMALYWHFKDKGALLDAMVERMMTEVVPADGGAADLRLLTTALLRVLRAHPALAEIVPDRIMRTGPGLDLAERVVGLLRAVGHSPELAAQLAVFLLNGLVSLVIRHPGEVAVGDESVRQTLIGEKRARLTSLPADEYPHLIEAADYFLGLPDEESYYERGVDLILTAVQRRS